LKAGGGLIVSQDLQPVWKRDAASSLIDLAQRLQELEQEQSVALAAVVEVWHQVILLAQVELRALGPPYPTKHSLIDQDYCAWVQEQIRLLHGRQFDQLDLEHLPDELHALAWFVQREIEKNLEIICNHLLKYKYAREYLNDEPCCASWRSALLDARQQIADELEDSPSLQDYPTEELEFGYEMATYQVYQQTNLPHDTLPKVCPWTLNQVLDLDWLPD